MFFNFKPIISCFDIFKYECLSQNKNKNKKTNKDVKI